MSRNLVASCFLLACLTQHAVNSAETDGSNAPDPSGVTDVVMLDESELNESSGLAISNRNPACFWSHNDSGGEARLYAFDRAGRKTGRVNLNSTRMNDWEDMASFLDRGVPRLLVADCGDNDSKRSRIQVHLFDEPDPTKKSALDDDEVQTITVTYEDGPRDCEAVAVDVGRNLIVFITKGRLPYCGVYTIPLPSRDQRGGDSDATAKRIATLPVPMVTALDLDPVNADLWLVSYFHTLCFRCTEPNMQLERQLSTLPDTFELPRWRQIEAVAIDSAHNVWLTSEGTRTPLGRLSPQALAAQRGHD